MYKYMTAHNTLTYADKLQDLMRTYNTRRHRIIKMSPQQAERAVNQDRLARTLLAYYGKRKWQPASKTLLKGSLVRIQLEKAKFARGYKQQTSEEIYRIHAVDVSKPIPLYTLQSFDKTEIIRGKFYANNLVLVINPKFKIKEVIAARTRRGVRELKVRWTHYNRLEWIKADRVINFQ